MGYLLIAGSRGFPANYGGFETLAHKLAENWSEQNIQTLITGFTKDNIKPIQIDSYQDGLIKSVIVALPIWSRLKNLVSTFIAVIYSVRRYEIDAALVLNDVNILSAIYLKARGIRTIIHLDGDESARRGLPRLGKMMHFFFRRMTFCFPLDLVMDSEALLVTVPRWSKGRIKVIKYGVDPNEIYPDNFTYKADWIEGPFILTVARFVPENNLKEILSAYLESNCKIPLIMIGKGTGRSGYEQELEYLKRKKKESVFILKAIYDSKLIHYLIFKSALYLHGHEAGGTNPIIVSARFYAKNILSHDNIYNREGSRNDEKFWRGNVDLVRILSNLELDIAKLREVKVNRIQTEDWKSISHKFLTLLTGDEDHFNRKA